MEEKTPLTAATPLETQFQMSLLRLGYPEAKVFAQLDELGRLPLQIAAGSAIPACWNR